MNKPRARIDMYRNANRFVRFNLAARKGLKSGIYKALSKVKTMNIGQEDKYISPTDRFKPILTPTEYRVGFCKCRGLSNKEIAEELFMAIGSVNVHLYHVYKKLGISGYRASHRISFDLLDSFNEGER